MDIVIASKNRGKIEEIKSILNLPFLKWHTFEEFPDWPDLAESGVSYRENALAKAKALLGRYGMAALADDSGLEVDALQGRPGPLSARYAGAQATDKENLARLLEELSGIPSDRRTARFRCWIAFVEPSGSILIAEGVCEGRIAERAHGSSGFGYDPVFVPEGHDRTFSEMTAEEKNALSHRGKALQKIRERLVQAYGPGAAK